MMQPAILLVLLPCMSAVVEPAGKAETIVYACPETAHFIYRDEGVFLTPKEYANNAHLTDGHRDDRMPPEVKKAEKPKKVAAKKKKKKKTKRKKRRA